MVQSGRSPVQVVSSQDYLSVFPFDMSISPKVGDQSAPDVDRRKTSGNDPSQGCRRSASQQQGAVLFQQHYEALQRAFPPNPMTGSRQNSKPLNSEEFEPQKQIIGFKPSGLMERTQSLPMMSQETRSVDHSASVARASSLPSMRLPSPTAPVQPDTDVQDPRVIGYFPSIGGIDHDGYVVVPPDHQRTVPAPVPELPSTPHHPLRGDQQRLEASFEMKEDGFFEHPGY